MSNRYSIGEVMCAESGEILLYGWIELEEAIKAIENCFDEVVQPSEVKEIKRGHWKYVPCRNNPDGYPGLYYPCDSKTRGAIKGTRVTLR